MLKVTKDLSANLTTPTHPASTRPAAELRWMMKGCLCLWWWRSALPGVFLFTWSATDMLKVLQGQKSGSELCLYVLSSIGTHEYAYLYAYLHTYGCICLQMYYVYKRKLFHTLCFLTVFIQMSAGLLYAVLLGFRTYSSPLVLVCCVWVYSMCLCVSCECIDIYLRHQIIKHLPRSFHQFPLHSMKQSTELPSSAWENPTTAALLV